MKDSTVLRTAKVGGFNKEDVLTYVDELNSKIDSLKKELEEAKGSEADVQELEKYRSEVSELQTKLEDSQTKLAAAESNVERMNKEIAQLTMDFEAEKQQIIAEKNGIELELEQVKSSVSSATPVSEPVVTKEYVQADTTEFENKISELEKALAEANSALRDKDSAISELNKAVSDKTAEIEKLRLDISELKLDKNDSSFSGGFDMGALFSEAQMTAKKIVVEARMAADKLVSDAKAEADTISQNAHKDAEKAREDALKDAADTVKSAEYVKTLIRNELDKLNKQFSELSDTINQVASRATDKFDDAKDVLEKARKTIDGESEINATLSEIKTEEIQEQKPVMESISIGDILSVPVEEPSEDDEPYIAPVSADESFMQDEDEIEYSDFELPDELAKYAIADDDIEAAEKAEGNSEIFEKDFDLSALSELASLAEAAENEDN